MADKRHDPIPPDLAERLLEALSPEAGRAPSARLRSTLMERIEQDAANDARITTVKRNDEGWNAFAHGVAAKVLNDDGRTRTWLARMERGARLPAHEHDGDEECMVLEGSVFLGDVHLHAGDYQIARTGSRHGEISSPGGCLLLIRSRTAPLTA